MSTDTAMDRLRAANPAPDTRLIRAESEDLAVLLATTWQRSTNMQTTQPQGVEPPQRQSRRGWVIAAATFALVIAVGLTAALLSSPNTDAEPAAPVAGPVTFRAKINLADPTVGGTFVVDTGADVLGCSSGTVVQLGGSQSSVGNIVMTCDSGPNTGTFTVDHGSEDVYVWNVVESSDDFAGLQGEGSWDFILTSANAASVVETFTGNIEYTP
jgi:hypothetical protein